LATNINGRGDVALGSSWTNDDANCLGGVAGIALEQAQWSAAAPYHTGPTSPLEVLQGGPPHALGPPWDPAMAAAMMNPWGWAQGGLEGPLGMGASHASAFGAGMMGGYSALDPYYGYNPYGYNPLPGAGGFIPPAWPGAWPQPASWENGSGTTNADPSCEMPVSNCTAPTGDDSSEPARAGTTSDPVGEANVEAGGATSDASPSIEGPPGLC
jgi:hypothetical protein